MTKKATSKTIQITCPICEHKVWLRADDGLIQEHNVAGAGQCPASNTTPPAESLNT